MVTEMYTTFEQSQCYLHRHWTVSNADLDHCLCVKGVVGECLSLGEDCGWG